jgi:kynurenine formamidase
MKRHAVNTAGILLLILLFSLCPGRVAGADESKTILLDMTYVYDENTVYWPTADTWKHEKVAWNINSDGCWYASGNFSASEHGGTHLDAPIHFAQGGRTIDQIKLEELIAFAAKFDVTAKCARDRGYLLTVADIKEWESRNGRLPARAWVIMFTGLGTKHYPDRSQVLGTDRRGQEALPYLDFPGFSPEAARFLVEERSITGVAIDTPSIDCGKSKDFQTHQIICRADRFGLENVACLDRLPEKGATLYVIPIPIKNGTGAPARVFTLLPQGK